ncbi:MAG: efflux RND transporter permease subunit [Nannocystis sp.]|nr:efflux RND transporter permease subunit [Nannocystis sp.]
MKLAEISIKRSIFATMMIAALMVFGLFALPRIGVELFPNVDFPVVTATVVYPGADPMTMETKVADPIEEALQSLGGVKRMTSRNLEGVTQVVLEFELEVDGNQALQEVRDKVSAIERQLPKGIDPPVVQKFDTGSTPVLSVALAGDLPIRELTKIADDVVKQRVQQIPGVGAVSLVGGREREIKILVDPARLTGYGLTVDDVTGAIQSQSLEMPAGYIQLGSRELTVKTRGEARTPAEIGEIVVAGRGGAAIRVRDLAEIVDGVEDPRSASFLNGSPAISLVIRKQSGANTVAIAARIRGELALLGPELDRRGVTVSIPSDSSAFVSRSIAGVKDDLIIGAVLTVLIILLFLHDVRATFIAALAIPTSIVGTFAFMSWMGFSFNNITMLALSLSIGILVDDAIVVIENIYRHLEMGKPRMRAALDATSEIGLAVIATTSSIVAVFIPVAYMDGIIGRFFYQFGITVSAAVLISMLVSFTLTPMLASRMMRHGHQQAAPGVFATTFNRLFGGLERLYALLLRWCLRHPWITLLVALSTLVLSVFLVTKVPSEFISADDTSEFAINVETPTGTSLDATIAATEAIAADVRQNLPGIRDTFATIGEGAQGQINRGKITVTLVSPHDRAYGQQEAITWVRERMAGVQGAIITVAQIDPIGGDAGFRTQPIQFSIRGPELDEVIAAADALKAELAATNKFVDLDTSYRGGKPEIGIEVDRNKAADLGVPVATIARTIRALVAGDAISTLKDGTDVYDVIIQLPPSQRAQLEGLQNLKVRAPNGQLVDLYNLVRPFRDAGPSEIERQNRLRQVVILADIDGIALGEAQALVEAAAGRVVPGHLTTSFLGDAEIMIESFIAMLTALLLAIILVYMILAAQFDSLIQPITIMVSLPLSVVGAFGGLYLSGMTLNMFSFIGIIMLMGLVTKTAILLVDFANAEREKGLDVTEALVSAGVIRMRPIFMTSAATIFGMVPVALALGEGGASRAPMAVCVIGGMITSTALTLVVIPVVYKLFDGLLTHRAMRFLSRKLFGAEAPAGLDPAPDIDLDPAPARPAAAPKPRAFEIDLDAAQSDPLDRDVELDPSAPPRAFTREALSPERRVEYSVDVELSEDSLPIIPGLLGSKRPK